MAQAQQGNPSGWTARNIARLLGIAHPTLWYWINTGLVTPDRLGRGRDGHSIGLSGLLEVVTVMELRRAGFSLQAIRQAVENLRQLTSQQRPLLQLMAVATGDDIVWAESSDPVMLVSTYHKPGQRILLVPVGEATAELQHRLETETAKSKR